MQRGCNIMYALIGTLWAAAAADRTLDGLRARPGERDQETDTAAHIERIRDT